MQNQPSGTSPHKAPYNFEYLTGGKWVSLPESAGRLLSHDIQENGHWYTLEFDDKFIREHDLKLELAVNGRPLRVASSRSPGYWPAFDDQLATLNRHPDPGVELYCFGFGAVWSDWVDDPELARSQYAQRLIQHLRETGRPY